MFNYTHEVIINNNVGTQEGGKRIGTYTDSSDVKHVVIERAGDYRGDLIFPRNEGVVFRTKGHEGSFATLTISDPTSGSGSESSELETGEVLQFSVFVKLLDPAAIAEYAYPNWASFGKPILVGFTHKDDFAAELVSALKDAIPYNNKFVTVKEDNGAVVLTASMFGLQFSDARLEKLVEGSCDGCNFDKYIPVDMECEYVDTVLPFGTAEHLVENYRFPTYANTRYAAINADETPVPGAIYDMFSFSYDSPRPGLGGLSGVGQKMDAVTRHIYWVRTDVADAFQSALEEVGATVVSDEGSSSGE